MSSAGECPGKVWGAAGPFRPPGGESACPRGQGASPHPVAAGGARRRGEGMRAVRCRRGTGREPEPPLRSSSRRHRAVAPRSPPAPRRGRGAAFAPCPGESAVPRGPLRALRSPSGLCGHVPASALPGVEPGSPVTSLRAALACPGLRVFRAPGFLSGKPRAILGLPLRQTWRSCESLSELRLCLPGYLPRSSPDELEPSRRGTGKPSLLAFPAAGLDCPISVLSFTFPPPSL